MFILVNYCPVLAEAGRQQGKGRCDDFFVSSDSGRKFARFCGVSVFPQTTYVEAGAGGPDVAVVTGDHCILNNFCGEELIVDITLPGHAEAGVGVWWWARGGHYRVLVLTGAGAGLGCVWCPAVRPGLACFRQTQSAPAESSKHPHTALRAISWPYIISFFTLRKMHPGHSS